MATISDLTGANKLNVNSDGSADVRIGEKSMVPFYSANDEGLHTGAKKLSSPETSQDYRLRVGTDTLWDKEEFNYTAQNTSKHLARNTTMTATYTGGALNFNGAGITTINTGVSFQTYRKFPVLGASTTYCETVGFLNNALSDNLVVDFGLFENAIATPFAPTDGVYFRINNTGFLGVSNYNGVEQTISLPFTHTINTANKFTIALGTGKVEFWIDDELYGELQAPIVSGRFVMSSQLSYTVREAIGGVAATVPLSFKLMRYSVTIGDLDINRLWPTANVGMGGSSIQGQSGQTQGQTANIVNSTGPVSGTLSNTAAAYTTMGGQFQFAAVTGAETDYALFAYVNPANAVTVKGKSLVIRGIWIDTVNMGAAVATTATLLQWSIGVGATANSLATAEGAATKAPRRLTLGFQTFPVGAAIGSQATRIDVNLDAPLIIEPGNTLHIIVKVPVGTATASQIIRGVVGVNGYFE